MNNTEVKVYHVVGAILYLLKTGCQWRQLPMKQFFRVKYRWQSVYHHFQKWCNDSSWELIWLELLNKHKRLLDMSNVLLDGTHTPSKRGGQAASYQGRKKAKTGSMLILTDNQGTPLACSNPIVGKHNDAFGLVRKVDDMIRTIHFSGLAIKGLFLNTDAGFDVKNFRAYCYQHEIIGNIDPNPRNWETEPHLFDELLYKCKFVVERTNAWLDAFKAIPIRFETKCIGNALNIIVLCVILLCRL